jgi:hypothetical protein
VVTDTYPLALTFQFQIGVISQFGFQPDGEGVIQFNQHIKLLEHEDQEVGLNTMLVAKKI